MPVLGGVYDAPLAGMFFAVEILLVDVTIRKVAFGLGMSMPLPHSWRLRSKGHCLFYDITASCSGIHANVNTCSL